MSFLEKRLNDLIVLDEYSKQDTPLNKINPLVKLIIFFLAIFLIVSVKKYDIFHLLLLTSFSIFLLTISPLKIKMLLKIILLLTPFILFLIIFNPVFDKNTMYFLGIKMNSGYISALVIYFKFINTTTLSILLVASTNFYDLAFAFRFFRIPKYISLQILITYRFIFLFLKDIINTIESIKSKSFYANKLRWQHMKAIISTFFVRSVFKGEYVYSSMLSRGFDIENINHKSTFKSYDYLFMIFAPLYLLIMRFI